MAQYDVYANPSRSAADGIPYVVVIQSGLLSALATRMTMPLAVFDTASKVPTALCPVIIVKGTLTDADMLTLERWVSSLTPNGPVF